MVITIIILSVLLVFAGIFCIAFMGWAFDTIADLQQTNSELLKACKTLIKEDYTLVVVLGPKWMCLSCGRNSSKESPPEDEHTADCPIAFARVAIKRAEEANGSTERKTTS